MQLIRSLPWDTHYQFSIKTLTLKQIKATNEMLVATKIFERARN